MEAIFSISLSFRPPKTARPAITPRDGNCLCCATQLPKPTSKGTSETGEDPKARAHAGDLKTVKLDWQA